MQIRTANQIASPQHKLEHHSSAKETLATQSCYFLKKERKHKNSKINNENLCWNNIKHLPETKKLVETNM